MLEGLMMHDECKYLDRLLRERWVEGKSGVVEVQVLLWLRDSLIESANQHAPLA